MDEIVKRAIKKTILTLRKLLEQEDIPTVLKQHGIFPDGRRVPVEKIALLDDAGKSRRTRLEAILEREIKVAGSEKAGVERYCREVTFTYINRLIALRCMEARGLIDECIKTRPDYAGRSLRHHRFRREHPHLRFDAEDTDGLKAFLRSVFRELQDDIKIVFDPDDEYSIIMPSLRALRECIRALNEDIPEEAFREPELIGWVYQYFQTEEKNRVFEEVRTKKKKIQGDDIVPATSLYTERYMVDYLGQNSLGAIWMEMYPDSKLHEKWPYFVKDQDLKPREPRPVKSLTFLDPACGSGHFLLVAFDLFVQMYEEEERLAQTGKVPKEWVVPKEKIATTILESNLHGIDIDLRSVQLSWLVLYLRMREHQKSVGAPKTLPKKVNLVAADASLLNTPEFISWCEERFKEEPYAINIIKGIAQKLRNLSEIGSLARPEEDLKELKEMEKEKEGSEEIPSWIPKTKLGKEVKEGKIKDIDEILNANKKILEEQIVDSLINVKSDLISIGQSKGKFGGGKRRVWRQTQKKTAEGNVPTFSCLAVVGDENGHVGIGIGKAKETLPAREKAIRKAKLNIIKVKRGCGSFDCSCKEKHSIPYKVEGKCGSSKIILIPAPQGTGLVVGDECKKILKLAGIKDIYSQTFGQTRTTINLAKACIDALKKLK